MIVFIIGVIVIVIGMATSSLVVVLLGGLLAVVPGLIIVVSIVANWEEHMDYICKKCGTSCRSSRGVGKNYKLCDRCDKIRQKESKK